MAELGALLWAPLNGRAQAATRSVSLPLLFRKLIHALIPAPLHFPPLSCSLLSVHLLPCAFFCLFSHRILPCLMLPSTLQITFSFLLIF